ncbi:hypothetical protein VAR608DRAFT_5580 [Variovorax sp. HW608]|uniref:hypothetical protein n=1 Tax=Variovorax sp. HW608 TaxID=1034889 RepID=UPI00081FAA20|nr:hypothetical protein [Variovorax sp. HW608]SCK54590.1 hypothetical protein VAR608DRAFT_5580 [Variovorax sp. HW608]
MTDEEAIRLYGTTEPQPELLRLEAGALSCEFEGGALRHVKWGRVEIARGVSYLFRDNDWGTVPAEVEDIQVETTSSRFVLTFSMKMRMPDGLLTAAARVEGSDAGTLAFDVIATPDAELSTNRCGFVVLHPAACAGKRLSVEHTNGKLEELGFPLEISPSQPVFDIRALTYSPAPGMTLHCRLEAALPHDRAGKFEMEDQRNWSDASFKTYVASLLDEWPYRLPDGVPLAQRVEFEVTGVSAEREKRDGHTRQLRLGEPTDHRLPALGIGVPAGISLATTNEHTALRGLGAQWWIVDADLESARLSEDICAVSELRRDLPVKVQLDAVVPEELSPDEAASLLRKKCDSAQLQVDAIRILPAPFLKSFQPTDVWPNVPPLEVYAQAARRCFPDSLVGGGMFTYFTELNRKRPASTALDFVGHATCPIVHAADDTSVMETIEALESILLSVRLMCPGVAYRLGPSTIASPRNPYGTSPASNPEPRRIPLASSDPRHQGQFGAAWTAAYAAACAHAGLDVLALHHSHGPCGPYFGSDTRVPAWQVLEVFSRASGAPVVPIEGLGSDLAGLGWEDAEGPMKGLVVNLTAHSIPISIEGRTDAHLGPFAVLNFVHDRAV